MGFLLGLIVGLILGWLLVPYLPPTFLDSLRNFASNGLRQILAWFAPGDSRQKQLQSSSDAALGVADSTDDLKKIEGIGPKIAELLNKGGIRTYTELAECEIKSLQVILDSGGTRYRIADPSTWPEQAKLAKAGDWESLQQFQSELKGGRR